MNLENGQERRCAGLAKNNQRISLAEVLLGRLEPVSTRWWKDAERIGRLDERQVTGMADATAAIGTAAMGVTGSERGFLGRQRAVRNQEYEHQLPNVGAPGSHSLDYSRRIQAQHRLTSNAPALHN